MDNINYKGLQDMAEGRIENAQDLLREEERILPEQIKQHIDKIKKVVGKEDGVKRPKNVVIIGGVGVGKSAFINTVIAAMSEECWTEQAYSGYHGTVTKAVTANTAV